MGTTSAPSPRAPPPPPRIDPSPRSFPSAPPPRPPDSEIVRNIEVLAAFVVKNGPQFEQLAQIKKAEDPKFAFLFGGSGYDFYEWKKRCLQQQIFAQDGSDDDQLKICKLVQAVAAKESATPPLISQEDSSDGLNSAVAQTKAADLTAGASIVEVRTTQDDSEKSLGQLQGARPVGEVEASQEGAEAREKVNKETRGLKLLRSALAEYVKEVLKPTWKEGHMSKDAYKTIVKKVVDKVSGTLHSHQIPKSQENVDQYMAQSQAKIAKLVQGYVERFTKS